MDGRAASNTGLAVQSYPGDGLWKRVRLGTRGVEVARASKGARVEEKDLVSVSRYPR